MKSKITKTQVILLAVCCCLLVVLADYRLIIQPQLDSCDKMELDLETMEAELDTILSDNALIPSYERSIEEDKAALSSITSEMLDLMNSEDFDILISSYMKASSLVADSPEIGNVMPFEESEFYIEPEKTESEEETDETNVDETEDNTDEDSEESEKTAYSGIKVISALYNCVGSYQSMLKFVDKINEAPYIAITSVSMNGKTENGKINSGEFTFTFTVTGLMYDKENTNETAE